MKRNIHSPGAVHECTGCQMCHAVCPKDCITIETDSEGFYRPYVEESRCIDCGLCRRVCYKFDDDVRITPDAPAKGALYGAKAKSAATVAATTSGGVADVLARHLAGQGYVCAGVEYDTEANVARHITADKADDVVRFRGSKYIQSRSAEALRELVARLKGDARVALFGTPCQTYAFSRFLEKRGLRDRCLLVDLYCHGCPTLNVWRKFIDELLASLPGEEKRVEKAVFRSKVRGWGNFYVVVVVVVDGVRHEIETRHNSDRFYDLFFSDAVLNGACYDCKLRSTLEYTDIRLGDFWGKEYVSDHKGVSAVSVCTPRGAEALAAVAGELDMEEKRYADFLPYQSYGKDYPVPEKLRGELLRQLADRNMPLEESIRTVYGSKSAAGKLKWHLKHWSRLLPNRLLSAVKALYYRI